MLIFAMSNNMNGSTSARGWAVPMPSISTVPINLVIVGLVLVGGTTLAIFKLGDMLKIIKFAGSKAQKNTAAGWVDMLIPKWKQTLFRNGDSPYYDSIILEF